MRAQFEKVGSGAARPLAFERLDREFPFHWHYHPEYELTLIVDSRGQRLVGDAISDYGPGDLVLIGPNLPHSWRSGPVRASAKARHHAVVVQFRDDFAGKAFFQADEMEPVARLLTRSISGLAFGHAASARYIAQKIMQLPTVSPGRAMVGLLDVLLDLAAEADVRVLSTERVRPMCRVEDQKRIDRICTYLNQRFEQDLDYAEVARLVHMDQAALCRFFKRATGRTITTYVNEMRVGAAAQLLTDTDLSLLAISCRVGFGNYSNFHRQFKRVKGYEPRRLRKQFVPDNRAQIPLHSIEKDTM